MQKVVVLARWYPWLIGACCLAPFSGLLLPDERTLPDGEGRDFVGYQLPIRQYARGEIVEGRFPLWIPYLGAGMPLHAGQQASLCHPLVTPLIVAFGADYGLKFCAFLHLALGFAGMHLLARRHNVSRPASSFAGVLMTWSGFAVNHLMAGHVTLLFQYALVPWFFLALTALVQAPGPLPAASLAGLGACLALSGHPQVFYYTILFGGLWAATLLLGGSQSAPGRSIVWALAAAVCALLVSAVQLLPSWELARDGGAETFRRKANFSATQAMSGLDLIRLLAPNLAGNPFAGSSGFGVGENFHERVVYVGLLAPLLAAFGLSRASAARWQRIAAWLLVLSLAIALGQSTPAHGWLLRLVPAMDIFRCPGRVFGVTTIFLGLLAAHGLDALVRGERRATGLRGLEFVALGCCVGALAASALRANKDGIGWHTYVVYGQRNLVDEAFVWTILALDTAALLLFAWRVGPRYPVATYCLAVFLVFLDLGWNNARNFFLKAPDHVALPQSLLDNGLPERFVEGPVRARLSVPQLRYSRLVPAAIAAGRQLLGTKEGGVLPAGTERVFLAAQSNARVALAVAGCDYACTPTDGECEALGQPLPRVRFLPDEDARIIDVPIEQLRDHHVQRMRERSTGPVKLVAQEPQRLTIDVHASTAGRVVLADTFYPGWTATVDGEETTIHRAHGVFRSVRVPEGRHRVVFAYEPLSFRLGLAGTVVGTVSWVALVVFGLHRRRLIAYSLSAVTHTAVRA